MSPSTSIDPLAATTTDLQQALAEGVVTSAQLVALYLAHIDQYEPLLNAFIAVAPRERLAGAAARLDRERAQGRLRSPLHGIPIVLKDIFTTAPTLGMGTTAGSWAFADAVAKGNSALAQKLLDSGLIILGKTNMTEFCGMKMTTQMPGWSAFGGQTISPYVGRIKEHEKLLGHSAPGGSSTGSAVAVAAGFAPLAIGSETIGSIITPCTRAGLYALKPTHGVQDMGGAYAMTEFFDSPGPMAKSASDLVDLARIMLGRPFSRTTSFNWNGLPVGFVDPRIWNMDPGMCSQFEGTVDQMICEYEDMMGLLRSQGCDVRYPIAVPSVSELAVDGKPAIMPIAFWEFKNIGIPRFIESFSPFSVRNLQDIVDFNERNKEKAMPPPFTEQTDLIRALENDQSEEEIRELRQKFRQVGRRLLDQVFEREGIEIIAAPADSPLCMHTAVAGYPISTVPLGALKHNARPFGICLAARAGAEDKLLRFMQMYEFAAPPRPVPDLAALRRDLTPKDSITWD